MKKIIYTIAFITVSSFLFNCSTANATIKKTTAENIKPKKTNNQVREVSKAETAPTLDGIADDSAWKNVEWNQLDQLWLGEKYTADDFTGQYKLVWREEALYLLVEITDDVLFDQYPDPLTFWWDEDCVEIFIDENNSGGPHLDNHGAFAYHVALDHNVVDKAQDKKPILFNDHITTAHITTGNKSIWEHKIFLYKEKGFDETKKNTPITLKANKKIGFALAYCDNDGSKTRENFIGSVEVPGEDKNQGYKNSDIFGTIILK